MSRIAHRGLDLAGNLEVLVVEGREVRRSIPDVNEKTRPPGAYDPVDRLLDLDRDGIWAELLFPSVGLWCYLIEDRTLLAACARVVQRVGARRLLGLLPAVRGSGDVADPRHRRRRAEIARVADAGFKAVLMPATPPADKPYNADAYEPLWVELEAAGLHVCFHVGTGSHPIVERGAGGAIINYVETFFPPQRTLTYLVSAGVLDRHPTLQFFFIEGGASWLPSAMERMDEAFSQHGRWVSPALSMPPSEFVKRQVHASFQHDRAALQTLDITGPDAIMWGSDYPHLEGTWPTSQAVLDDIFAGVDDATRRASPAAPWRGCSTSRLPRARLTPMRREC